MNTNPLQFSLSANHIESLYSFENLENSELKLQFQIRIGKIPGDGSSLIKDYLPQGLQIVYGSSVHPNNLHFPQPQSFKVKQPINCAELIHENMIKDLIYTSWTPDEHNYALTLNLVRKHSINSLIDRLRDNRDKTSSENLEKTKKFIINMLLDDDLVLDTGEPATCFRLFCPLSKTRMEVPVRARHCTHLQCFDAKTFLLLNECTPKWECPICTTSCSYDDLEIQYYFFEILSSSTLSDDCSRIEFQTDGVRLGYYEKKEMEKEQGSLYEVIIEVE